MITQTEVVGYLKAVKLGELRDLITALEDTLGVKASAPQMFIPQGGQEPVETQTEFDVVLLGYDESVPKTKMSVIKAVRKLTGLGLKEAKTAVESAPYTIGEALTKEAADELAATLREASGTVEVR
jgi:large subunit ribosomal protein L7/L12